MDLIDELRAWWKKRDTSEDPGPLVWHDNGYVQTTYLGGYLAELWKADGVRVRTLLNGADDNIETWTESFASVEVAKQECELRLRVLHALESC